MNKKQRSEKFEAPQKYLLQKLEKKNKTNRKSVIFEAVLWRSAVRSHFAYMDGARLYITGIYDSTKLCIFFENFPLLMKDLDSEFSLF